MRIRNIQLLVLCVMALLIANITSACETNYPPHHTADYCSDPGLALFASAYVLDSGQNVTLTVSVHYSKASYSYTYLNMTGGSTLYTVMNVTAPSSSFTFSTSAVQNSTFEYGVNVTDNDNVTCFDNVTLMVNPALSKPVLSPINPTITSGQSVAFNVSVSGGTPPYFFKWYSGSSANCTQDSLVKKTSYSYYTASPTSTTYFCVMVTDSAAMKSSVYSNPDLVTVVSNSTNSTTTTTISTSSTTTAESGPSSTTTMTSSSSTTTISGPGSTSSTSTTTVSTASTTVSGGNSGSVFGILQDSTGEAPPSSTVNATNATGSSIQCGGTVGSSGHRPTILEYINGNDIGSRILNFSNHDSVSLMYNTTFTVFMNFITPTSVNISINCNPYISPLNVSMLFLNTSSYAYFTRLVNVSYLPISKSVTLLLYRHPNMVPPTTSTTSTTTIVNTTTTSPKTTISQPTTTIAQVSAPSDLGPALIGTGIAIALAVIIGIAYSRRRKETPKGHADKSDSSAK